MNPNHPHLPIIAVVALFAATLSTPALASSNAAWTQFRSDVEQACRAAAGDGFLIKTIAVDPFGSNSYGLARLTGHEPGTRHRQQLLCAYDKHSKQAEVGTPMALATRHPVKTHAEER